eukprot:CAMPEP_0176481466 /NCGR_PEP_ID=MMETSP0200_2-20121128/2840_1 /TAXON_ID=947934 /ORGANISM="Chaetoceros sp., Strain GSL56" /LENGTH=471 /DNA_ID=CAMNT_0017877683 /DNA_START=1154 /DNA_END=2569 /DNA_ORIENTATION=+
MERVAVLTLKVSNEICHDDDDGNDHDYYDDDDASSVDTNDAFLEFIGLTKDEAHVVGSASIDVPQQQQQQLVPSLTLDDIPDNHERITTTSSASIKCISIDIPPKCSRHFIPPSSCLALVLEDVLTQSQCNFLIQKASNTSSSSRSSFRYIYEATHKAPDGSTYTVEIQNPNPHKLAAIDTFHRPHKKHDNGWVSLSTLSDVATQIMDELYMKIYTTLKSHPSFVSFQERLLAGNMQGLNPRMRILKYDAEDNDRFDAHFDATTFVPSVDGSGSQRQSLITVLLYLNDGGGKDFEGGETVYLDWDATATATATASVRDYRGMSKHKTDSQKIVKVVPKAGSVVVFEHDLFHSGAPLTRGTKYIMRTDILFSELAVDQEEARMQGIENINTKIDDKENGCSKLLLVSDICEKLDLSKDVCSILNDMDLYGNTCEAFLAPGITVVKSMLVDGGMTEDHVTMLLKEVMHVLKKK